MQIKDFINLPHFHKFVNLCLELCYCSAKFTSPARKLNENVYYTGISIKGTVRVILIDIVFRFRVPQITNILIGIVFGFRVPQITNIFKSRMFNILVRLGFSIELFSPKIKSEQHFCIFSAASSNF